MCYRDVVDRLAPIPKRVQGAENRLVLRVEKILGLELRVTHKANGFRTVDWNADQDAAQHLPRHDRVEVVRRLEVITVIRWSLDRTNLS
jgi:hypothetical protein